MWFFRSPQIIFGDDALSWLAELQGICAFIVTDRIIQSLGYVERVREQLVRAGVEVQVFDEVEPEPCLETVHRCARQMAAAQPDWVIGLGGGSCIDAAKAAWFIYERPDVELEAMNPLQSFGLRVKARLITIPTTAGSGSEASQAAMIFSETEKRKLELGTYELVPDFAIVDPLFSGQMPPSLTADSGIDVLAHAVEAYNAVMANDFTDALCLQAFSLVFHYLPRAVEFGANDMEARQKMANASIMAGAAVANSMISLAHAMSHSVGAVFHLPHGRLTGAILPYTIEYLGNGGAGRFLEMARAAGLCAASEAEAAPVLANAVRSLLHEVGLPLSLQEAGLSAGAFTAELDGLCERSEMDLGILMVRRPLECGELRRLFEYAYAGRPVDF